MRAGVCVRAGGGVSREREREECTYGNGLSWSRLTADRRRGQMGRTSEVSPSERSRQQSSDHPHIKSMLVCISFHHLRDIHTHNQNTGERERRQDREIEGDGGSGRADSAG